MKFNWNTLFVLLIFFYIHSKYGFKHFSNFINLEIIFQQ